MPQGKTTLQKSYRTTRKTPEAVTQYILENTAGNGKNIPFSDLVDMGIAAYLNANGEIPDLPVGGDGSADTALLQSDIHALDKKVDDNFAAINKKLKVIAKYLLQQERQDGDVEKDEPQYAGASSTAVSVSAGTVADKADDAEEPSNVVEQAAGMSVAAAQPSDADSADAESNDSGDDKPVASKPFSKVHGDMTTDISTLTGLVGEHTPISEFDAPASSAPRDSFEKLSQDDVNFINDLIDEMEEYKKRGTTVPSGADERKDSDSDIDDILDSLI